MMNKERKKAYINEMKDFFLKKDSVLVTHYQGLTVKQIDELKSEMRKHGILFRITKNRIIRITNNPQTPGGGIYCSTYRV